MGDQFYFRGNFITGFRRSRERIIEIPKKARSFHVQPGNYIFEKSESDGYKYLTVYPESEWRGRLLQKEHISERQKDEFVSNSSELEVKVRTGGVSYFNLPGWVDEYLNSRNSPRFRFIGSGEPYFEVWKPKDFEKYESLADLAESFSVLADRGV